MTTKPNQSTPTNKPGSAAESGLARFGLALANWSERWFPDPLIFAFAGVIIVFIFGLLIHQPASKLVIAGGKSFWTLVPFTMQMVMIIIGGYVLATTPLVHRFIRWLATLPKNGRTAVAMIALFSMLTSMISWGLSLIFSGLLTREMARRVPAMDYRAAGGAAYLGLGATWALGLSSSAAMLMATKSAIPPSLLAISGLIPLRQSIFLWQGSAHRVHPDRGLRCRCLPLRALGGERPHGRGLRNPLRADRPTAGAAQPSPASGWNIARC